MKSSRITALTLISQLVSFSLAGASPSIQGPWRSSALDGRQDYQLSYPTERDEALHSGFLGDIQAGGQVRIRPENLGGTSRLFSRTRLTLTFGKPGKTQYVIAGQDARDFTDHAPAAVAFNDAEVYWAYAQFKREWGQAVLGLQSVPGLHDQRLISHLDWHIRRRNFTGAHVKWNKGHELIAGYMDRGLRANGNNATLAGGSFRAGDFDIVALHRSVVDSRLERNDTTWGFHLDEGNWNLSAYHQTGNRGAFDVDAWAAAGQIKKPLKGRLKPALMYEASYASGDDDPTSGTIKTFDPLYNFAHFYNGYADQVGWRNLLQMRGQISVKPGKNDTLWLDVHQFWLANARDSWYAVNESARFRDATGASGTDLGWETDLAYKKAWPLLGLDIWGGTSWFFPLGFAKAAGVQKAVDFQYLQVTKNF